MFVAVDENLGGQIVRVFSGQASKSYGFAGAFHGESKKLVSRKSHRLEAPVSALAATT